MDTEGSSLMCGKASKDHCRLLRVLRLLRAPRFLLARLLWNSSCTCLRRLADRRWKGAKEVCRRRQHLGGLVFEEAAGGVLVHTCNTSLVVPRFLDLGRRDSVFARLSRLILLLLKTLMLGPRFCLSTLEFILLLLVCMYMFARSRTRTHTHALPHARAHTSRRLSSSCCSCCLRLCSL